MNLTRKKIGLTAIIALFAITLLFESTFAIWQTRLDEDFDKDQQVQLLRWPWRTPPERVTPGWHYNPRAPYFRAEGRTTDYSWGLQDYIYNILVRRNDPHQAIWCAYTNQNNVDRPRYPADLDYENNQWAWVWWGDSGMLHWDLRSATAARVSFWYYLDVTYGSGDSLVVLIADSAYDANGNVDEVTLQDWPTIRRRLLWGAFYDNEGNEHLTNFSTRTNEWQQRSFSLDDLRQLDANGRVIDTVSVLGQRGIALCFLWYSNATVITGKGAFIDDVVLAWDDGLFDLQARNLYRGFPVNQDSIYWSQDAQPRAWEPLYLRCDWTVAGDGETPEFTIDCTIDGELFHRENRRGVAGDSLYQSISESPWTAQPGRHVIAWTIDSGNAVEESDENNNSYTDSIDVWWNPPPEFGIVSPAGDSTVVLDDGTLEIVYSIADSNATDTLFTVYLYWTEDTTGLTGNWERMFEYTLVGFNRSARIGENRLIRRIDLPEEGNIFVCGFCSDGNPGNTVYDVSGGRMIIASVPSRPGEPPTDYQISRIYPNPFNRTLKVDFTLPIGGTTDLQVIDITGRLVETLASGNLPAGRHSALWVPEGIGAGVYFIRLNAADRQIIAKAVYTP